MCSTSFAASCSSITRCERSGLANDSARIRSLIRYDPESQTDNRLCSGWDISSRAQLSTRSIAFRFPRPVRFAHHSPRRWIRGRRLCGSIASLKPKTQDARRQLGQSFRGRARRIHRRLRLDVPAEKRMAALPTSHTNLATIPKCESRSDCTAPSANQLLVGRRCAVDLGAKMTWHSV